MKKDVRLQVTVPPGSSPLTLRAVGQTLISSNGESVTLDVGESAIVERGHIVAPKRVLDERLAILTHKLNLKRT